MSMAPLVDNAKVNAISPDDHKILHLAQSQVSTPKPAAHGMTTPSIKTTAKKTDTKKVFRCTFPGCGREFQLKGNLKRHVNIHNGEKKFACKYCGKKFLRKADMEVHYRVHTGEKPYRCTHEECEKCFARRSDLLSHERTHTGKKPYACAFPGCDRSFARKFDLHKHQRLHDTPKDACKAKTKKRKLEPMKSDTGNTSCDCPTDVMMPVIDTSCNANAEATLKSARSIKPTCLTSRRKLSATSCVDTPTRSIRYELKCPEHHIHSPPACLAALSSLDAFLLSQETLPFSLDALPLHCPVTTIGTSCCPAHLELRPPPPEHDGSGHGSKPSQAKVLRSPSSTVLDTSVLLPKEDEAAVQPPAIPYIPPEVGKLEARCRPPGKLCLATPTSSLLDYALHNPSCGHLSIQHGDHRDYVVQNHLVCQDSVKRLSAVHWNAAATKREPVASASCTLPKEGHRPGCGHLAVRHKDHIDYVVEDSLICQQASWLEDDNLELLDDDFWDFYGAIDAFPTM